MSKKNTTATTASNVSASIADFASDIKDLFLEIAGEKVLARAEIVLTDFARKEDERQQKLAIIENEIATAKDKLSKAEKVSNQAALAKTIAYLEADKVEIITLMGNAAKRREAFISKFETNPYGALADSTLVREEIARKFA